MSGESGFDRTALLAWLKASCTSQGVPLLVRDPGTIAQVATLLGRTAPPRGRAAPIRTPRRTQYSEPPLRLHAVDVQRAGTGGAPGDDGVVEHGLDDGLPPVESNRLPFAA